MSCSECYFDLGLFLLQFVPDITDMYIILDFVARAKDRLSHIDYDRHAWTRNRFHDLQVRIGSVYWNETQGNNGSGLRTLRTYKMILSIQI